MRSRLRQGWESSEATIAFDVPAKWIPAACWNQLHPRFLMKEALLSRPYRNALALRAHPFGPVVFLCLIMERNRLYAIVCSENAQPCSMPKPRSPPVDQNCRHCLVCFVTIGQRSGFQGQKLPHSIANFQ